MAGEQDLKLDGAGDEEESGGGKKKLIIIIVAVLLLVAISVGATIFLMGGMSNDSAAAADGAAAEEEAEKPAEPSIPAQYITLMPEFVINYQVGPRQRFLQVTIEVMTYKQSVIDAFQLHEPMIRNEIISVLGRQEFNNLRTNDGRLLMQQELKNHLENVLKKDAETEGIEAILFTNLVMQ